MKKNLTIGLIVLFILSGIRLFAQETTIRENRSVGSFSAIKVSGIAQVYLTKSATEKVDVEVSHQAINDRLIVEVVDQVLVIRMKNDENWKNQNYSNAKVRVNVNYRALNKIEASGVTQVTGESFIESDKVDIGMSGVSSLKLNVNANSITVNGSGTAKLVLSGSTKTLNTQTSGVANIKAYDLSADDVKSEASGASNTQVSASRTLSAKTSGASQVNYKGNPSVTSNDSRVRKI